MAGSIWPAGTHTVMFSHLARCPDQVGASNQVPRPEEILEMNHINLSTAELLRPQFGGGAPSLFSHWKEAPRKTEAAEVAFTTRGDFLFWASV